MCFRGLMCVSACVCDRVIGACDHLELGLASRLIKAEIPDAASSVRGGSSHSLCETPRGLGTATRDAIEVTAGP